MTDITTLVTALGGDSKVPAIYDTRYSVTQGAGVVTAWDDARGGGFGPQLVGQKGAGAYPAWDSVNQIITFDGSQNYMKTAISSTLDPSTGRTYIYIGTLPAGNFPLAIADAGVTKFITLCTQSATIKTSNGSLASIFSPVTVGTVRRLAFVSYAPANFYGAGVIPVNATEIAAVQSRAGRQSLGTVTGGYLADAVTAQTASNWQLWLGNYASQYTANVVRAVIVLDHPVTESDWRTIESWSATYHAHVVEAAVTRVIYFDGNSLTIGQGATAGNDYPSQVMGSTGFTTNCDYVNAGVSGREGAAMVSQLASRIPGIFNGPQARRVYVCWEIGNDLHAGKTAAQAVANVQSLCQAAKVAGATHCVAVTCAARSDLSGATETARLAANVLLRALPSGIDAVADVAAIVNLQTTSNLTYFQADGIHLTDAGYAEVALNAVRGVGPTITGMLTATKLGVKTELIRAVYNPISLAYEYVPIPRQPNFIAATGKTLDYRQVITAQASDNTVDTTYTGTVTAAITSGTCTLGGTTSHACVAGVADFSDLTIATGTGTCVITFSASGLTSFSTPAFTVVAPVYDAFALSQRAIQIEKPRLTVDTTMPTVFAKEYTINPGLPASSTNFQTINAGIAKFVSDNLTTHTRFKITPGTYAEVVRLLVKSAATGWCVFEPAAGPPTAAGGRVAPSHFTTGAVKITIEDQDGVIQCTGAAHHYRFNGIEIKATTAVATTLLYWNVALVNRNFELSTPGTIDDYPSYIILDRCWVHGGDTVDVRHMIQPEGRNIAIMNCYVDDAHNKFSGPNGSGDEQCISTVGAPGPLLITNNRLRGSGENMLFGGADPPFYDARNRDLTVTFNYVEAPLIWQGVFRHKNNTEVKCCERMYFYGNVHDGAWDNNQNGTGINIGSNSSGTVVSNFEGVLDLVIECNFYRTMTAWMLITSANTANVTSARRIAVYNNVAVNLNAPATRYSPTDHINQVMAIGSSATYQLAGIVWEHNDALANTTLPTRFLSLSGTPAGTSLTTYVDNNIATCSDAYGIIGDGLAPGTASTSVGLPDDPFAKNALIAPVGSAAFGGTGFPVASYYPALNTDLGFTNPSITATWATIDPDLVCAALTLLASSLYKAGNARQSSDGKDVGANMTLVRAAIAGVWAGTLGATTATSRSRAARLDEAGFGVFTNANRWR